MRATSSDLTNTFVAVDDNGNFCQCVCVCWFKCASIHFAFRRRRRRRLTWSALLFPLFLLLLRLSHCSKLFFSLSAPPSLLPPARIRRMCDPPNAAAAAASVQMSARRRHLNVNVCVCVCSLVIGSQQHNARTSNFFARTQNQATHTQKPNGSEAHDRLLLVGASCWCHQFTSSSSSMTKHNVSCCSTLAASTQNVCVCCICWRKQTKCLCFCHCRFWCHQLTSTHRASRVQGRPSSSSSSAATEAFDCALSASVV